MAGTPCEDANLTLQRQGFKFLAPYSKTNLQMFTVQKLPKLFQICRYDVLTPSIKLLYSKILMLLFLLSLFVSFLNKIYQTSKNTSNHLQPSRRRGAWFFGRLTLSLGRPLIESGTVGVGFFPPEGLPFNGVNVYLGCPAGYFL